MYSFLNKPSRFSTIVTFSYLVVGATYPFLLSYKGSINTPITRKGVANIRDYSPRYNITVYGYFMVLSVVGSQNIFRLVILWPKGASIYQIDLRVLRKSAPSATGDLKTGCPY